MGITPIPFCIKSYRNWRWLTLHINVDMFLTYASAHQFYFFSKCWGFHLSYGVKVKCGRIWQTAWIWGADNPIKHKDQNKVTLILRWYNIGETSGFKQTVTWSKTIFVQVQKRILIFNANNENKLATKSLWLRSTSLLSWGAAHSLPWDCVIKARYGGGGG